MLPNPMAEQIARKVPSAKKSALTREDEFAFLIEEVLRKLRRSFDEALDRFGLSRSQWRALFYLFVTPGMTQTELARRLELERASVGSAVDRLESLGLLERRALPGDRRVWTLHLSRKALAILPELRREADGIYAAMVGGIAGSELKAARSVLRRMSDNLKAD